MDLCAVVADTAARNDAVTMPRQKLPITRPPCPFAHKGDVWLDGFYAKGTDFERPRFFCQPKRDPATGMRPALHPDGRNPLSARHLRARASP